MKRVILAATACCMVSAAMAATTADTVRVVTNPSKVIITEDSLGSHVSIVETAGKKNSAYTYTVKHAGDDVVTTKQDTDWNLNIPFVKSDTTHCSHWSVIFSGLYAGWGWYTGAADGNGAMVNDNLGHTREFGMLNILGVMYSTSHGQSVSVGVGMEARRFRMHGGVLFAKDESGVVTAAAYPDNARKRNSQIMVGSVQFPIMLAQKVKNVKFFAGPLLQLHPWAKIENKYTIGDRDFGENIKRIHHRKFTCDLMGGVSWEGCGLYVRYQPQNVLRSTWGPEFKSISMGLIIGM